MNGSTSWLQRLLGLALAAFLAVPVAQAATDSLPSAPQPANQAQTQSNPPAATGAPAQSQDAAQNTQNNQPLGTAAAPAIKPEGIAVSRPAGAAIAPAKQRRIHQWAIRVGLLVGAGIAIGTVAALSLGSPARPH